ncbi:MAG TPA: hypothetical protein VK806_05415 [Bacteroidia bacterium]|nr:hypothetical protein [Bacteroidia bacterium]
MITINLRKLINLGLCLFSILFVILISSCKQGGGYKKEVATLDSLKTQLKSADSLITKIDTVVINKDCNHIMIDLDFVQMLHKDTMSAGAAQTFRDINSVRWFMQKFMGKRNVIKFEINKSMDQLSHLSHDLGNNLIKADSVQFYYGFEVKKASELIETVKLAMVDIHNQIPLYGLIAPQADSLVVRLKNHHGI